MRVIVSSLMTVSALLTACSTAVQDSPAAQASPARHVCRSEAAAARIGQAAPDDTQLKQRTGAELIRRIAPGDAVTHDFRENRVTIAIDPAGKVVEASCG